jgi:hypothetical protein
MLPIGTSLLSCLFASLLALAGGAQDAPPSPPAGGAPATTPVPAATPAPVAKPAETQADPVKARVDAFLDELERSGATTASLSGNVAIETNDLFKETSEYRAGRLVVEGKGSKRRIALHLDELIVDGHASKTVDHYIFADGWYCRLDHKNRSFTKRNIARGEDDPLQSVGGQIPIPIGLKKTDILARFTVNETQIPVDIPILGSMQNVAGLKLVPKEGTEAAKETDSLELFFDRVSLAPIGVVIRAKVARPEMARWTAARLTAPVVNGDVSEADRAKLVVPERAPEGWATVDETK